MFFPLPANSIFRVSKSKTLKIELAGSGKLATPGIYFHIVKILAEGLERYLAMGGRDGSSYHDSVEEFDVDTLTWKPASPANLLKTRGYYGAVSLDKSLVC